MRLVDLIIPVYKGAEETLAKALASVVMQSDMDKVRVTIVDDDSGEVETYAELVQRFNAIPGMEIQLLTVNENSGPGICRQIGIDATNLPYVMFLDSDDQLASKYSVRVLLAAIMHNDFHVVLSDFSEEIHDLHQAHNGAIPLYEHARDCTWMFGKLYRRDALVSKEIRFNASRATSYANEDGGFNALMFMTTKDENIGYVNHKTYIWSGRADSITRSNDREYSYNKGFVGFVENQIYAIEKALASPYLVSNKAEDQILTAFLSCYRTVAECYCSMRHRARFFEMDVEYAKKFYLRFRELILAQLYSGPKCMGLIIKLVSAHIAQQYTLYDFVSALDPTVDIQALKRSHLATIGE